MAVHLVLGGARSGKSAHAERAALAAAGEGGRRVYLATAQAFDAEMAERIAHHRASRGDGWRTIEAPLALAEALLALNPAEVALVDCLTLWLSNAMLAEDGALAARVEGLLDALARREGQTWLVSNEVGWGVVPDNPLARRFRDEAGRLNQRVATLAESVTLVVAGLRMQLK